MQTAVELPESLYEQAKCAAGMRGVSVQKFIADALEEKLRAGQASSRKKQRVQLPLVPASHPGTRPLTAERVAELLSDGNDSR